MKNNELLKKVCRYLNPYPDNQETFEKQLLG